MDEANEDLNPLQLIEYKKLLSIMENELENKEAKMNSLMKMHEELKGLHERTRGECNELNQKLLTAYAGKSELEGKHRIELTKAKQVS